MGDPGKFQNVFLYYGFHILLVCVCAAELFIFFYAHRRSGEGEDPRRRDQGTKWLLYANFVLCIYCSFYFVSRSAPAEIRALTGPYFLSYIGMALIPAGIFIRAWAVLTLKKEFTLTVQTAEGQRLVTKGLYRTIRNPAYTGSILSLLGIALALRNIAAVAVVFALCMVCYGVRIRVEEKALEERFQSEFREYRKHTFRLFPFVW